MEPDTPVVLTKEEFCNVKTLSSAVRASLACNQLEEAERYLNALDDLIKTIEQRYFVHQRTDKKD